MLLQIFGASTKSRINGVSYNNPSDKLGGALVSRLSVSHYILWCKLLKIKKVNIWDLHFHCN